MKRFIPLIIFFAVLGLGAAGYLSIKHFGLEALISTIGVAGIAGIIFAESGLLVGFFLPGDSLLFTAGFLVQLGIIKFNIYALMLILFIAAVVGDNVGYAFGRRYGRKLFRKDNSLLFNKKNLQHAEDFYKKHGSKTIILARFVPVVRTFAPIIAGISRMDRKTFFIYNLLGGLLWAVGLTYIGYAAGGVIIKYGIDIEYVILGIIFLSVLPPFIHVVKQKEVRDGVIKEIKAYTQYLRGK